MRLPAETEVVKKQRTDNAARQFYESASGVCKEGEGVGPGVGSHTPTETIRVHVYAMWKVSGGATHNDVCWAPSHIMSGSGLIVHCAWKELWHLQPEGTPCAGVSMLSVLAVHTAQVGAPAGSGRSMRRGSLLKDQGKEGACALCLETYSHWCLCSYSDSSGFVTSYSLLVLLLNAIDLCMDVGV